MYKLSSVEIAIIISCLGVVGTISVYSVRIGRFIGILLTRIEEIVKALQKIDKHLEDHNLKFESGQTKFSEIDSEIKLVKSDIDEIQKHGCDRRNQCTVIGE